MKHFPSYTMTTMHHVPLVLQELYKKNGGVLLDNHMVTDITPGPVVTVVTNKAIFKAKQLVITAGAWAPTLLKKLEIHLPFKVIIILFGRKMTLFQQRICGLHHNICEEQHLQTKKSK